MIIKIDNNDSNLYVHKGDNFLIPQRVENFERFLLIISQNTGFKTKEISYISPLWTYKLLTFLSALMVIGEIYAFVI